MDLLTYLSFFILGFWTAKQIFSFKIKILIKKIAKEHNIAMDELEEEPKYKKVVIPILTTEPINNDILVYDQKNNFMCQGKSLDEIAANLLKYKNIKLAIILHANSKFWFVEGKVKEA